MKGAIGNAFILNIIITFIIIFLMLVVGSMAYTKAYKTKNYLINKIVEYVETPRPEENRNVPIPLPSNGPMLDEWNEIVNPYLARSGYILASRNNTCPNKEDQGYTITINTRIGQYEYCIYNRVNVNDSNSSIQGTFNYMVLVYMKLDLPIIGNFIKIPITGETKLFVIPR